MNTNTNIKIAVCFAGYNCVDHIDKCLKPWLKLKNELNLVLIATNGRYSFSNKKLQNKGWGSLVKLVSNKLDFVLHGCDEKNQWTEEQSKKYMLNIAKDQKADLIWLVDCDEFYTETEIFNILNIVKNNPDYDGYYLNYKNYVFSLPYWIFGFGKRVIYWINKNNGIKDFYFDNDIEYNNGIKSGASEKIYPISKQIAFIEHYTWLADDPRTEEKITHQNVKHFGEVNCRCNYMYDNEKGLIFNDKFYNSRNMLPPSLHETLDFFMYDFEMNLDVKENKILITSIEKNQIYYFKIFDDKDLLIHDCLMDLEINYNYYIQCFNKAFSDLKFIRVEVFDSTLQNKMHNEKIHINLNERFFFN